MSNEDAEFDLMSPTELARAWLDASIAPVETWTASQHYDVIDYCNEVEFDYSRLVAWLLALADMASTPLEVSIVGAGPIEDELRWNMDFARKLELHLDHAKLIAILSAVWIDGSGKDVEAWYHATMRRGEEQSR